MKQSKDEQIRSFTSIDESLRSDKDFSCKKNKNKEKRNLSRSIPGMSGATRAMIPIRYMWSAIDSGPFTPLLIQPVLFVICMRSISCAREDQNRSFNYPTKYQNALRFGNDIFFFIYISCIMSISQ